MDLLSTIKLIGNNLVINDDSNVFFLSLYDCGQKQTFEYVILGFGKDWSTFCTTFWQQLID